MCGDKYEGKNDVDGKKCVEHPVSDKDFNQAKQYEEGPTSYTGGGSNEKNS